MRTTTHHRRARRSRARGLPARGATAGASALVLAATVLAAAPPASAADDEVTAVRRSGEDRVATALAVTRDRDADRNLYGAPAKPSVVLASADAYADALAATALADRYGAPLLLTGRDALDPRVAAELADHLPAGSTVRLLGGDAALSPAVAAAVTAGGWRAERVAGADRYATAAAVAALSDTDPSRCDVIVSTGTDFADGAAAAAASRADRPLLFTDGDRLPPATAAALEACAGGAGGAGTLTAVGGPAARAAASLGGAAASLAVTVASGGDRYATAAALAPEGAADGWVVLTTGEDFPDALVGGTYGVPVLLTRADVLPEAARAALSERRGRVRHLVVVGGSRAVSDGVLRAAADLLGATVVSG